MANPRGNPENLRPKPWQPGQSGNPKGSSAKVRRSSALRKMLEEKGFDVELQLVMIAKAVGRKELLEYKTKDGKVAMREPDLAWLTKLYEILDSGDEISDLWEQIEQLKARRANRGDPGGAGGDAGDGGG